MAVLSKRAGQEKIWIPELYRQKLMGYAESFQELARSLVDRPGEETKEAELSEDIRSPLADRQSILELRRIQENKLLLCDNLSEVAQIMTELADELYHYRPIGDRCRRMLVHALRAESIYAEDFCYLRGFAPDDYSPEDSGLPMKGSAAGDEEEYHGISMTLSTDKKGGIPAAEVAELLSALLCRPLQLSVTSPYRVEKDAHGFVFMEEAKYVALTGFCKITKENEVVSGDHYSILESEKGKLTLLLSDGTGSGERASADSERVLDLMEKLLEAGYGALPAINMVNAALLAGGQEYCHPTLDMCDLDLYSGNCCFYKVGGAASFLKRGRNVEQISQGSLPLGIFRSVEVNPVRKQLQDGDFVILMTDGVLDALGEGRYEEAMEEAIAELREVNPGEIAERLLELALRGCSGHIRDDMTVLVAGVWRKG